MVSQAKLLLLAALWLLGRWEPPGKGDLMRMLALGILRLGLNTTLFGLGVGMITALIYASTPLRGMLLGT
ncbi:MAG: hypothetical protein AVDCRST_MAG25-1333 [uncultured Rubrobacteraceae bacterium]|uniref:Uncharacterized protein n=1 Tax=uncultured Rubrobacteraceae bacterium TaxID=349277 RepID=A0A6J4R573_9ACTN|nr:MAG: hypothetical protein AVDCRST_MAG25-1333 [uncultured Rubrobacteraceae bacterium]